jgi:hypothetical protein
MKAYVTVMGVYAAVNKVEIETDRETQRHKGTEALRKRRDKICYLRRFLSASVPLCLCVSHAASIFSQLHWPPLQMK